ncbi:hypothetical protein OTK49_01570 [Vibrio coralliirubri]|uniref:hypothetical protein n=1 Tax=Vibrio coralliirubri TaxID=1516159 RepID=UPI002283860A|nr:hypothetical protein [Vibrio coralliirubri]MCY9861214.1 hypothetical protein [Vibrio coralliirubri]
MTDNKLKLDLSRQLLKGFRGSIEMTRQFNAKVIDNEGQKHEIKIPRLAHEDMLCLYSIVAATYYSEKAVHEAIDLLTDSQSLADSGSIGTYEQGCLTNPTLTFDSFFERYGLPKGNLMLIDGKYSMQDEHCSISSGFQQRKNPYRNFVEVFSWYLSLMFGAENFKNYLAEAHTIVCKKGRYTLNEKGRIGFEELTPE